MRGANVVETGEHKGGSGVFLLTPHTYTIPLPIHHPLNNPTDTRKKNPENAGY